MTVVSGSTSVASLATPSPTSVGAGPRWPLFLMSLAAVAILVGTVPLVGSYYLARKFAGMTLPGIKVIGDGSESATSIDRASFSELPTRVHELVERFLARRIYLQVGAERIASTWRDLGASVNEPALVAELRAIGHGGDLLSDFLCYWHSRRHGYRIPLRVKLDEKRALEFLIELKDEVDRAPMDARLDLERHSIAAERSGYLLRVYDSLVAVQYAVRALYSGGKMGNIVLSVAETPPQVRKGDLKDIDVSHVLATWETRYSTAAIDSDRTYNLKVGADKLNGYILRPGQTFSFNTAVGDRTEKQGYRIAPVIMGGELVDGLAGGMCQIASTLHAAAFFAGLDILRTTPHSRPSAYIPMGLDSTVVYPTVDLKLRNAYDFPIVIHYVVNQGSVKVELLGKQAPYHVAFEREILAESKFATMSRTDSEMPMGQKLIEQEGYDGYRIKRRRYIYTGKWKLDARNDNQPNPDGLISKREWEIAYPATTQIVRVGTGSASLKPKAPLPAHRIPPIPESAKPLYYIFR